MQFGRSYEKFEVGATYRHSPGKTVTDDDHLFCPLTMNHHPLRLGTSVPDVSGGPELVDSDGAAR